MTDDFDPVRYRQGLLEARSAAMEYVANQLRPVEEDEALDDDEALNLLVDLPPLLLTWVCLCGSNWKSVRAVSVERWTNWKDERSQANVCWWEGEALMSGRDYQAWETTHHAMTKALIEILQAHHFEVEPFGSGERLVRRPRQEQGNSP